MSARQITDVYECEHRVRINKAIQEGAIEVEKTEADPLITELGQEHERRVKEEIERLIGRTLPEGAEEDPFAESSYQARIISPNGGLYGIPDFLLKPRDLESVGVESPAEGIEPVDAKLARSVKTKALLQVATYGRIIGQATGVEPSMGHLLLADPEKVFRVESHPLRPLYPLVDRLERIHRSLEAWKPGERTWGEKQGACDMCPFKSFCADGRTRARDLTLLSNVQPTHRATLRKAGIETIDQLALTPHAPVGMEVNLYLKLHTQAKLRVAQLETGEAHYQWASPENGFPEGAKTLLYPPARLADGLRPAGSEYYLPEPDEGDVFFDFEGNPHEPGGGLEYLFGWVDREAEFTYLWADNEEEEREALEKFVNMLVELFQRRPQAHLYHYAPYEKTALRRMAKKYHRVEREVEKLIEAGRFVDLYAIARGAFIPGSGSYSIKKLEPLYMPGERSGDVTTSLGSVDEYAKYRKALEEGTEAARPLKSEILAYNKYDCVSTLELYKWLDGGRKAALGQPRRAEVPERERSEKSTERKASIRALEDRLERAAQSADDTWHLGLKASVGFYAREDSFFWGEVLRKHEKPEGELDGDPDVAQVKRIITSVDKPKARSSKYLLLELDRESRLSGRLVATTDKELIAVETSERSFVKALDPKAAEGFWVLGNEDKLRAALEAGRVLLHPSNVPPGAKESAVMLLAERALLKGEGTEIARRVITRKGSGLKANDPIGAVAGLDEGAYLAIQGPPGSGKTYLSVEMIKKARDLGWSVGVTCVTHNAVKNVLEGCKSSGISTMRHDSSKKTWPQEGEEVRIDTWAKDERVKDVVLGGTAFAYASLAKAVFEGKADPVDLLIVDEASQMPLVDFLAVSGAAKRMILLGDPRQLPHVSQALHPEGWDVSVLGHLSEGKSVLPAKHGFFLDKTRRMQGKLAEVVSSLAYDGRLSADESCQEQQVNNLQGVRFFPVEHYGRSVSSPEEAEAIKEIIEKMKGVPFKTDKEGTLGLSDIIVVAPYNRQVQLVESVLKKAGLSEVRVGTVDRFQGQEAVVSIYSLTASSEVDAPRGAEFIFDGARVNVAISRARALAIVVGSPALAGFKGDKLEALYSAARAAMLTAS